MLENLFDQLKMGNEESGKKRYIKSSAEETDDEERSIKKYIIPKSTSVTEEIENVFDYIKKEQTTSEENFNIILLGSNETGKSILLNQIRSLSHLTENLKGTVFYQHPKEGYKKKN